MVTITEELLEEGLSRKGGWNKKQLQALGVKDFLQEPGWKKRLIGAVVTEEQKNEFLRLKNAHLDQKRKDLHLPTLWQRTQNYQP